MLEFTIIAVIFSGVLIYCLHRADERKRQRKIREKFRKDLEAQARFYDQHSGDGENMVSHK